MTQCVMQSEKRPLAISSRLVRIQHCDKLVCCVHDFTGYSVFCGCGASLQIYLWCSALFKFCNCIHLYCSGIIRVCAVVITRVSDKRHMVLLNRSWEYF
jgi:hypothetical protein